MNGGMKTRVKGGVKASADSTLNLLFLLLSLSSLPTSLSLLFLLLSLLFSVSVSTFFRLFQSGSLKLVDLQDMFWQFESASVSQIDTLLEQEVIVLNGVD